MARRKSKKTIEEDLNTLKKVDLSKPVADKMIEEGITETSDTLGDIVSEQAKKDGLECINFLMAVKVCVGDLVNIKYSVSRGVGIIKAVSPYAVVIEDDKGNDMVIRLKYISSITVIKHNVKQV